MADYCGQKLWIEGFDIWRTGDSQAAIDFINKLENAELTMVAQYRPWKPWTDEQTEYIRFIGEIVLDIEQEIGMAAFDDVPFTGELTGVPPINNVMHIPGGQVGTFYKKRGSCPYPFKCTIMGKCFNPLR